MMEGGADSGFRHAEPDKYQSRLFHFCGTGKNVVMTQVNYAHWKVAGTRNCSQQLSAIVQYLCIDTSYAVITTLIC